MGMKFLGRAFLSNDEILKAEFSLGMRARACIAEKTRPLEYEKHEIEKKLDVEGRKKEMQELQQKT